MTPINTSRLIDAAVPPIPSHLLTPPIQQIRRRAVRRRAAFASCAAAVAVVLVTVGIVAIGPSGQSSTMVGSSPTPISGPPNTPTTPTRPVGEPPPGSWRLARVDRTGAGLTIYVNPDRRTCQGYEDAVPVVEEHADTVVIAVTGAGKATACGTKAAPLHITLTHPLGTRTLRDGRDGTTARAYFDSDLPQVPAPWSEVPASYSVLDGYGWSISYTRPGGPDLMFIAGVGGVGSATTVADVTLGSVRGAIIESDAGSYRVRWKVRDLTYMMMLVPREGATTSLAEAQAVINQLTWP